MSAQVDSQRANTWKCGIHLRYLQCECNETEWVGGGEREEIKGLKKSVYSRGKLSEVMSLRKKTSHTTCDPANVVVVWGTLSKSLKLWKVPSDFDLTSTLLKRCASMLTENWKKGSQHPKKKLECPSESVENCSWRILRTLQESLLKWVQAVLKSKVGHTKSWLSSSLEMYKLKAEENRWMDAHVSHVLNHCT